MRPSLALAQSSRWLTPKRQLTPRGDGRLSSVRPRTLSCVSWNEVGAMSRSLRCSTEMRRSLSTSDSYGRSVEDHAASASQHAVLPDKEYFPKDRSVSEWRMETQRLLDARHHLDRNIDEVVETIRFWTTQRTHESASTSLRLFSILYLTIKEDMNDFHWNWTSGNYPRATHLLNAVLDSWRIVWVRHAKTERRDTSNEIMTPRSAFDLVKDHYSDVVDCRMLSIIMMAAKEGGNPRDAPEFCEEVLNHMLDASSMRHPGNLLPDTVAFTTVLDAWAKSGRVDASERALALFQVQQQLNDEDIVDAAPSTITYNTMLFALTNVKNSGNRKDLLRRRLEQADLLVQEMMDSPYRDVRPDTVTFRLITLGWTLAGDTQAGCRWLLEMARLAKTSDSTSASPDERLNRENRIQVDAALFSKIISELAKNNQNELTEELYNNQLVLYKETQDPKLKPDVLTMRAMLIVYAKTSRPQQAEAMLQRLEKNAGAAPNPDTRNLLWPKRGHYRDVLFAWAKSGRSDAAERAQRILLRMIDVWKIRQHVTARKVETPSRPAADAHSINAVLRSWARSSRQDAAEEAESLLEKVEAYGSDGLLKPIGRSSYLRVMKCWARGRHPDACRRVQLLLEKLMAKEATDRESGITVSLPTSDHFTVAMEVWAQSEREEAGRRVEALLDMAVDSYKKAGNKEARPDKIMYAVALTEYARNGDIQRAERTFVRMLDDFDRAAKANKLFQVTAKECNLVLLACVHSSDTENRIRLAAFVVLLMRQRGIRPNRRSYDRAIEVLTPSSRSKDQELLQVLRRERGFRRP